METLTVYQLIQRLQAFPQDARVVYRLEVKEDGARAETAMLPVTHVCRPEVGVVVIE